MGCLHVSCCLANQNIEHWQTGCSNIKKLRVPVRASALRNEKALSTKVYIWILNIQ